MNTQPPETPRTDAATWIADSISDPDGIPVVRADVCKAIELENAALAAQLEEARRAMTGMLENYITLKEMSLVLARSDAPNWIGRNMTADDDIHVIAVRKSLAALTERKEKVE
jgi:hypothetical protein